jgi:glycosyltransferase involved in cell wall biosynthesis
MKIAVVIFCRNEEQMLPWVLKYYSQYVDEIYALDNMSTDRSYEIISKCPIAKLIQYDTGGVLRDDVLAKMKSEFYRALNVDYSIIVDVDEFMWHADGLRKYLSHCLERGITFPIAEGWQMIGEGWPVNDNSQITDHIRLGIRDEVFDKHCIIQKNIKITYGMGAHGYDVTGKIVTGFSEGLKLLHYKWVDKETTLKRIEWTQTINSKENIEANLASYKYWWPEAKCVRDVGSYYDKAKKERIEVIPPPKKKQIFMRLPNDPGLMALVADLPNDFIMVEVGCYAGESTEIFANKALKIFAVDPWIDFEVDGKFYVPLTQKGERTILSMDGVEDRFNKIMDKHKNIIKMKGTSVEMASNVPDASVDVVYIDADHEYLSVVQDIKLWLRKIKPGGIISGHDYNFSDVSKAVADTIGQPHKLYCDYSWAKRLPIGDEYRQVISVKPKIRILELNNQLIHSGTDKHSQIFIKHYDRLKFDVFMASWAGGERLPDFVELCNQTSTELIVESDSHKMLEWIKSKKIDIARFPRLGIPQDKITLDMLIASKIPIIIENNCFGHFDPSPNRNKINKHIVCSKWSLEAYKKRSGEFYDAQKTVYIYCPIEVFTISEYCKNRDYNRPIFGRYSRKDQAKWHPIQIQALPLIKKAVPEAQFHVIGMPDEYVHLAQQLGVIDMIKIFPIQSDVGILEFLKQITVFAHSACLGESFGNSIAEAMSSGLPIVTHTVNPQIGENAQSELVVDNQNGYVVDLDHPWVSFDIPLDLHWATKEKINQYANYVIKLLLNPQLKIELGGNGKKMAFELFDAAEITRKTEKIYVEEMKR